MDDGFFVIIEYELRDARCRMQDTGDSLQVSDHRLVTTDHWLLVAGCWWLVTTVELEAYSTISQGIHDRPL